MQKEQEKKTLGEKKSRPLHKKPALFAVSSAVLLAILYFAPRQNLRKFHALFQNRCNGNGVFYKGRCYCDLSHRGKSCFSKNISAAPPEKNTALIVADYFEEDFVYAGRVFLARQLERAGEEVSVLVLNPRPSFEQLKKTLARQNIRMQRLPQSDLVMDGDSVRNAAGVYEHIKQNTAFAKIFFFGDSASQALLARKQGLLSTETKFVAIYDTQPRARQIKQTGAKATDPEAQKEEYSAKLAVELADMVLTPNKVLADRLFQYGWAVKEEKMRTVQLPGLKIYSTAGKLVERARDPFPKRQRNITEFVFIGALSHSNGLDLLLDAFDYIVKKDPKQKNRILGKKTVRLHFFGQNTAASPGSELSGEELVRQRALAWGKHARVTVSKNVSLKKIVSYMAERGKARVAVLPAKIDSSGFLFHQLLKAGVNVLASSIRTHKEMLLPQDRRDVLFTAGDFFALAKKLVEALSVGGVSPRPLFHVAGETEKWNDVLRELKTWRATLPGAPDTKTPLVSVVVAHHNRHALLRQSLRSLEKQTYPAMEIVVVDDGSTDPASIEYVSDLGWRYWKTRRWRVLREPNRYVGAARNTGARHAKGEYVLFFDDDDVAKPHLVSTMVRVAQTTGADIVTTGYDLFRGNSDPRPRDVLGRRLYLGNSPLIGVSENCFGDSAMLVEKRFLENSGRFTEDYGVGFEDYEFLVKAGLNGATIEAIPEGLRWHRRHPNTVTQLSNTKANRIRFLRSYNERFSLLHRTIQDMVRLFQQKHFKQVLVTSFSQKIEPRQNSPREDDQPVALEGRGFEAVEAIEEVEAIEGAAAPKETQEKDGGAKGGDNAREPSPQKNSQKPKKKEKKIRIVYEMDENKKTAREKARKRDEEQLQKNWFYVQSASYINTGGEIELRLNRGVGCTVGREEPCKNILRFYTITASGRPFMTALEHCRYRFISAQLIRVSISENEFLSRSPPFRLGFLAGNKYQIRNSATTSPGSIYPLVEIDRRRIKTRPSVVVNATQVVGTGQDVVFDLSRSTSGIGYHFIDAEFDATTPRKEKSSALKIFLKTAATEFVYRKKTGFTVPSRLVEELFSYTFTFTLKNIVHQKATASVVVQRIGRKVPAIFIDGPAQIKKDTAATFSAFLSHDFPGEEVDVGYVWTLTATQRRDGMDEEIRMRDAKTSVLAIERGFLPVGSYVLALRVQYSVSSMEAAETLHYTHGLSVLPSEFTAEILGWSRTFPAGKPARVYAAVRELSAWTGRNDTAAVVLRWKLSPDRYGFELSAALDVFVVEGKGLAGEGAGEFVDINPGKLKGGVYVLYLHATHPHTGQTHETDIDFKVASRPSETPIFLQKTGTDTVSIAASALPEQLPAQKIVWSWRFAEEMNGVFFGAHDLEKKEVTDKFESTLSFDFAALLPGVQYCVVVSLRAGLLHGSSHIVVQKPAELQRGYCKIINSMDSQVSLRTKLDAICVGWGNDSACGGGVRFRFSKLEGGEAYQLAPASHKPAINILLGTGSYTIKVDVYDNTRRQTNQISEAITMSSGDLPVPKYFHEQLGVFARTKNINHAYQLLSLVGPVIGRKKRRLSPRSVFHQHGDEEEVNPETVTAALKLIEDISRLTRVDAADTGPYLLFYLGKILPENISVDQRPHVLHSLKKIVGGMEKDTAHSTTCFGRELAEKILQALTPIFRNPRNGVFLSLLINEIKEELQQCFVRTLDKEGRVAFKTDHLDLVFGILAETGDCEIGPFSIRSQTAPMPYRVSVTETNLMRQSDSIDSKILEIKTTPQKAKAPRRFLDELSTKLLEEKNIQKLPEGASLSFSYPLSRAGQEKLRAGMVPVCVMYVRGEKVKESGWTSSGCLRLRHSDTHVQCQADSYGEFAVMFRKQKRTSSLAVILGAVFGVAIAVVIVLAVLRAKLSRQNTPLVVEPLPEERPASHSSANSATAESTVQTNASTETITENDFKTEEEGC
ncbi:MAG: uncharacterized protein A8A55_1830 [Amphiamblys sp. WSBS2006]|nr:MAG: uncharacterized protein A8A55_1830 [Amphiamblys sp. WSBS2006]